MNLSPEKKSLIMVTLMIPKFHQHFSHKNHFETLLSILQPRRNVVHFFFFGLIVSFFALSFIIFKIGFFLGEREEEGEETLELFPLLISESEEELDSFLKCLVDFLFSSWSRDNSVIFKLAAFSKRQYSLLCFSAIIFSPCNLTILIS